MHRYKETWAAAQKANISAIMQIEWKASTFQAIFQENKYDSCKTPNLNLS